MRGVAMIGRNPLEPRPEIALHLSHENGGPAASCRQIRPILRGEDQAELVPVIRAASEERLSVGRFTACREKDLG